MRLADFILRDMQAILSEWEAFAGTRFPAATNMTPLALRDHAEQILQAVAKDLSVSQTRDAQIAKSTGRAPKLMDAPETAAQTHGFLRAQSGFQINQMASEYRALRSSVLRLWMDAYQPDEFHAEDIIRFNEAIDEALAESIAFFNSEVDRSRNLFLGMLGHDMRAPLQAIQMTATLLGAINAGDTVSKAASRLINSGGRMQALLDDLVEFNRIKLGLGIAIHPANFDVAALFADELEELRVAYPGRQLELQVTGQTRSFLDGPRVQRLLGNLVVNALKYGTQDAPVRVVLMADDAVFRFEVRNSGLAIDPSTLEQLFEPLKRGPQHKDEYTSDGSLGLGLYIAREIARAHGGEIEARSENKETVFAVCLPR